MSIGKFAKETGLSTNYLRQLHKSGVLVPDKITDSGTRYYSERQLQEYLNPRSVSNKAVLYARVSTKSQADDLERQVEHLKLYAIHHGYQFEILTDIGSGINYNKPGLKELVKQISNKEIQRVVVLYKDRLLKFGFELIEYLCEFNDVVLEVVDHTTMSKEEELMQDLIQIITVYANRLYGQRSHKTKELLRVIQDERS